MFALRRSSPRAATRFARFYATNGDGSAGATGSFRGEGSSGDSFTKREQASEDYYVKQHEKESLEKLREEISRREKDLATLKDKAKDLSK